MYVRARSSTAGQKKNSCAKCAPLTSTIDGDEVRLLVVIARAPRNASVDWIYLTTRSTPEQEGRSVQIDSRVGMFAALQ